jgi:excisionase family DNA binding protein
MEKNCIENAYKSPATQYSRSCGGTYPDELFNNLKWMTTNEAATYLRKSVNAIRTAVCRGHIRPRKFRRRLYFKRSELDRLIETS